VHWLNLFAKFSVTERTAGHSRHAHIIISVIFAKKQQLSVQVALFLFILASSDRKRNEDYTSPIVRILQFIWVKQEIGPTSLELVRLPHSSLEVGQVTSAVFSDFCGSLQDFCSGPSQYAVLL